MPLEIDFDEIHINEVKKHINKSNTVNNNNKLKPEGYCHSCFEDVSEGKLFCNNICASSYEYSKRYN